MDDDQWHGRVSVQCTNCAFHETHNFEALTPPKLVQIQYIYADGRNKLIMQKECRDTDDIEALLDAATERHPLPEGAKWQVCWEPSEQFIYAALPL